MRQDRENQFWTEGPCARGSDPVHELQNRAPNNFSRLGASGSQPRTYLARNTQQIAFITASCQAKYD